MADKSLLNKTIKLKKSEATELKEISFSLTKQAINSGHQKIYKESDIVHFLIEKMAHKISLNQNGELTIN